MPPVINTRKCPAQPALCKPIQLCPTKALYYIADENEPLSGKIILDEQKCTDCGICVQECFGSALTM